MTDPGTKQDAPLPKPLVMSLAIRDRAELHAAYMPMLRNGGLFVPGARHCQLGDEVFLLLSLMQDESRYPIAGRIAWITPEGTTRLTGVGVHFPEDEAGGRLRRRIEELLGTALGSARATHTL